MLFVDDDERVLRAIRRLMQRVRPSWHAEYEALPARALERIDRGGLDVVVTDMHMPGISGAEVLARVQTQHPEVARVVLSGDPSLQDVFRTVPVAHQFLTKPFESADVTATLDRALELRVVLRSPELRSLVAGHNGVPSAPRTFLELNDALADGEVSMAEVSEILARDVGMTARLMQMASSAFFSVPRTLKTVESVAAYLGLNTIRALVLSAEIFEIFPPHADLRGFDVNRMQRHALITARLAQRMMVGTGEEENALMAAMLHDIGLLVLAARDPKHLGMAITLATEAEIPLHEAERRLRGVHHGEIGAYLLGLWGLPLAIVDAVQRHHEAPDPGHAREGEIGLGAAVYFANTLADGGTLTPKAAQPPPGQPYLTRAKLGPRADDWTSFAQRLGC